MLKDAVRAALFLLYTTTFSTLVMVLFPIAACEIGTRLGGRLGGALALVPQLTFMVFWSVCVIRGERWAWLVIAPFPICHRK